MKTFQQFMEQSKMNLKGNMPNTIQALQGIKTNTTINNLQNMLKSGEISIGKTKEIVGDGSDLKNLKFNILSGVLNDLGSGLEKVQTKVNKMK